ncbi:MAG: hypothetical protein M1826_003818, partial [Phylliscum demangeonii]
QPAPPSLTYQERKAWFLAEHNRGWKGVGRARKVWAETADGEHEMYDGFGDWQACVDRFPPIAFPFPTSTKLANMQYLEGEMDFDPAVLAQMDALSDLCAKAVRTSYRAHWKEVDKLAAVKAAESEYPTWWPYLEVPYWRYLIGKTFNAATTAQLETLSDLCARAVRAGYDDKWARTDAIEAAEDAALRGQGDTVYGPHPTEAEIRAQLLRDVERALQEQGQGQSGNEHGVSKMMTKVTTPARRLLATVDRRLVTSLHRLNVNVAHAAARAAAGLWRSPPSSSSSSRVHDTAAMRQRVAGRVVQQELGQASHF